MPEPNEVYEPSDALVGKQADEFYKAQDARNKAEVQPRQAGMPYSTDDLPPEINGVPVQPYEEPERVHRSFTRSQIERMDHETYERHKADILFANANGLIIDDKSSPEYIAAQKRKREERDDAFSRSDQRITLPYSVKMAEKAADEAYEAYKTAQDKHDSEIASDDPRVRMARFEVVKDRKADWDTAIAKRDELKNRLRDMRLGKSGEAQ